MTERQHIRPKTEPQPLEVYQERCYCWRVDLPYEHTLAEHAARLRRVWVDRRVKR